MLLSLKTLQGFTLQVKECPIGRLEDFLFDDQKWVTRYAIVDIGPWYGRTELLISPISIDRIILPDRTITTHLTRSQVLESPPIDTARPIDREVEMKYLDHYRWPYYWTGEGIWGSAAATLEGDFAFPPREESEKASSQNQLTGEYHLRSIHETNRYHIKTQDDRRGKVNDFLMEEGSWKIRNVVVDIGSWFVSKLVLIPIEWIKTVDWRKKEIFLSVPWEKIEHREEYRSVA